MSDEREGLPSASGAERIILCPGSFAAESACRADEETPDSAHGNAVHLALATGETSKLSDEEEDCYERCKAIEERLIRQFFGEFTPTIIREERIWMFRDMRKVFSGKADLIAFYYNRALVLDFKSLWGTHTESPRNTQLRSLAILVNEFLNVDEIGVALVQPCAPGTSEICVYDREALRMAEFQLDAALAASRKPDAPRIPGEKQCKYCRAKMTCPEAQGAVVALRDGNTANKLATMDGPTLSNFLSLCDLAEDVIGAARKEGKKRLDDGQDVPGWKLKDGQQRRTITDVQAVFGRVSQMGVTAEQFAGACGLGIGDLETLVRKSAGIKGKALADKVTEVLDGCVEVKQTAKQLTKE